MTPDFLFLFRYLDFQELGGVRLKDLKTHTNAVGGRWGDDTWAALVKDNFEEAFDNTSDAVEGLDDTQPKRSLLIPLNVFPSSQIIKIATMLGQTEDYKKFGADEETPSGVEDPRNSTQRTGTSLNLVLSDVSSIMTPNREEDEIIFDELRNPTEDNFLNDEDAVDVEEEDEEPVSQYTTVEGSEDDMNFTCMDNSAGKEKERQPRRTQPMKAKQLREITQVDANNKTFFVCPCGFSSTNRSGSSRHKCRNSKDTVLFNCKECGKLCQNPGSLKRHFIAMHKSRQSMSLPVPPKVTCSSVLSDDGLTPLVTSVMQPSGSIFFTCI